MRTLSDIKVSGKSKMADITGSRSEITYISARIHDSNVISTAKPMFWGSGYTTRLLRKLPDVWTSKEMKMASVDRKLFYAIFDYSQIHKSSSLRNSLVLLLDPKNMGIAVGISLQSIIEAEIHVIAYALPVMAAIFELPLT